MIFDGFFIYHLIQELNQNLTKARLEKIVQTDLMTFIFVFYFRGERKSLLLNLSPNGFSLHLSEKKHVSQISSQFLTTMKKHLEGAILENITQYETDRVITLHFTMNDFIDGPTQKQVIFEAMGKHSNLLLVKDDIIIDTYKKMFFEEGRQLLPMAKFEYFPSDKKSFLKMTLDDAVSPKDLVDRYLGISPYLAKYIYEQKIYPDTIPLNPTRDLKLKKDYVSDIFDQDDEKKHYTSISKMMDDHIEVKSLSTESHALFIDKQIKKLSKKSESFESAIEDSKQKLENRVFGEYIYQSGLSLDEKRSSIDVMDLHIPLDPTKTLNENAQLYFKAYQKAKRSLEHINEQAKQNDELISLFDEFKTFLSLSNGENLKDFESELIPYGFKGTKIKQVNKKQASKPLVLKLTEGDIFYYVGKNNVQNEFITHSIANKEDYWFHVKDAPGGHVVVTAKKLNEHIIRKAAMLAANFSKMKHSSSIPVDYTQIKNIKKIAGMPGYHVSYKNQQTIYIDIDEDKLNSYLKNV